MNTTRGSSNGQTDDLLVLNENPLKIHWKESIEDPAFACDLVRYIAAPHASSRCRSCHAPIYCRRHKLCGVCGQSLPLEVLFSKSQASRLEALLESERQKHRAWMKR